MKNALVIIPSSIKPPPSEEERSVAYIFARHYNAEVEFLGPRNTYKQKTPDFKASGLFWEIKSPEGKSLNSLEKHLVRGLKQASNIIIDSRKSKLNDLSIGQELYMLANKHRKIQKILLLNKSGVIKEIYIKGKSLHKPLAM